MFPVWRLDSEFMGLLFGPKAIQICLLIIRTKMLIFILACKLSDDVFIIAIDFFNILA